MKKFLRSDRFCVVVVHASQTQKKRAVIRVVQGVVDRREYQLSSALTYIGSSDHVQIRIRGTGLLGWAPEGVAMIADMVHGYFILSIKEGYTKLNGRAVVRKEQLRDGDIIEAGRTTLKFEELPEFQHKSRA